MEPWDANLWQRTACPAPDCPPLHEDIRAEVAIIGAGYTGLTAALRLAELGRDVVVLEEKQPGHGASGRNTGWWIPFWVYMPPSSTKQQFGEAAGQRFAQMMLDGARLVPELVRKHDIKCDIREVGLICAARTQKTLTMLQRIAQEWRLMGVRVDDLDRAGMRRFIATDRYIGGVHYFDSGHLQPVSYCRGLAAAAQRQGARVHGQSPVTSVTPSNSGWSVTTPSATVQAKQVLVATNAYPAIVPQLRSKFLTIKLGMQASAPFPDKGRSYLPGGVMVTDIDAKDMFSVAFDTAGRLVTSALPPFDSSRPAAEITRHYWRMFCRTFPAAPRQIEWESVWHGHVCVPLDGLAKVDELAPGLFTAFGYSGNGIAQASMVGTEMAEWMTSGERDRVRVPSMAIKSIPGAALISGLANRVLMPAMNYVIYR